MAIPFWYDDPAAWDLLHVGTHGTAPGIATVNPTSKSKWDQVSGAGIDGAYSKFQGDELAEVEVELVIWKEEHIPALDSLIRFIRPRVVRKGQKVRTPVEFFNAALTFHGLRSVTIKAIKGPSKPDKEGFSKVVVTCEEWRKPPKTSATVTPKGGALGELGRKSEAAIVGRPAGASTMPSKYGGFPAPVSLGL